MGRRLRVAAAPAGLALARLRRRPRRWLLPAAGIALTTAFAALVAGEATVAGDRAARATLAAVAPPAATVRVTAQGNGDPDDARVSGRLGPDTTRAALFQALRLGGGVVQLAAITPLAPWGDAASPGPCTPVRCPLLATAAPGPRGNLALPGAGLVGVGQVRLRSAVPLGFRPFAASAYDRSVPAPPPVLLSGDVRGLEHLPGLASVYRTTTWVAPLGLGALHAWQLAPTTARLQRTQADLVAGDPGLTFTAPFDALAAARARAADAPIRLLLTGGGGAAIMAAFVLLAAGALRSDTARELDRLRTAGATGAQRAILAGTEAGAVSAVGLAAGAAAGLVLVGLLAAASGEPASAVLAHSLATPAAGAALLAGWASTSLLLAVSALVGDGTGRRAADALALAAAAALVLALARGRPGGSSDPLALLLAPLCCLAAGAVVLRAAAAILRAGERASRRAALPVRLALVNLARAPAGPAAAAAFLTVAVGLGVFALCYRATLAATAAAQAAGQVPLDAIVSAGPSLAPPLALAPLARWRALAGGSVLAVRRTEASFPSGGETASVPVLGLPAAGLALLRGAGSAAALAGRLVAPGPARSPGPMLPAAARGLRLTAAATGIGLEVSAVLRDPAGRTRVLGLGAAGLPARRLRRALPGGGPFELAALEVAEPAGLSATSGHQNAESPVADLGLRARLEIDGVEALGGDGRPLAALAISGWRARGAASGARPLVALAISGRPARGAASAARPRPRGLAAAFDTGGATGLLRPAQPGDARPLPVLVDPATAAQAGRGGRLALSVDGVALTGQVVGRIPSFPTLGGRFVVADGSALGSRLDAEAPGQGRADELWLAAPDLGRTRAALADPALASLHVAYRADLERGLRADPVVAGVTRTLDVAAPLALLLAAVGLLLVGAAPDRAVETDLAAQGLGPRALRLDLRLRLLAVAGLGLGAGLAAGLALSRLAVAALGGSLAPAEVTVPVVAVVPWPALGLLALAGAAGLAAVAWALGRGAFGER